MLFSHNHDQYSYHYDQLHNFEYEYIYYRFVSSDQFVNFFYQGSDKVVGKKPKRMSVNIVKTDGIQILHTCRLHFHNDIFKNSPYDKLDTIPHGYHDQYMPNSS